MGRVLSLTDEEEVGEEEGALLGRDVSVQIVLALSTGDIFAVGILFHHSNYVEADATFPVALEPVAGAETRIVGAAGCCHGKCPFRESHGWKGEETLLWPWPAACVPVAAGGGGGVSLGGRDWALLRWAKPLSGRSRGFR